MTLPALKPARLPELLAQQLQQMIREGAFKPGERLPSERELAQRFAVSRPSLREAIQKLEQQGLLKRRQGGGSFVAEPVADALALPLAALLAGGNEVQFDLLEFRLGLEQIAAYYAALRGTEADFQRLAESVAQLTSDHQPTDLAAEAQAVMVFIERMVEASHNLVLLQVVLGLKGLLVSSIEHNLALLYQKPDAVEQVRTHRRLVLEAIVQRQAERAREAVLRHLAFIEESMLVLDRERSRQARALRRLGEQPR